MAKRYIAWSISEKRALIDAVWSMRLAGVGTYAECFEQAQKECISPERWRFVPVTKTKLPWLFDAIEQKQKESWQSVAEEIPPPEQIPAPTIEDELVDAFRAMLSAHKKLMQSVVTDTLRNEVKHTLIATVRDALMLDDAVEIDMHDDVKELTHRPTVAILGLLNQQEQIIKQVYDHVFKLRFLKSEVSPASIYDSSRHADYVIVFANKMGHSVEGALRNIPHIIVHGGLTRLKNALNTISENYRDRQTPKQTA